jgi:tRNA(Ile)-lysidine synthase
MKKNIQHIFQETIRNSIPTDSNFLLAVSGGLDSMVLAHLFQVTGLQFAIAHCNFQLRGQESEGDEELVQQTAAKWGVPFYTIRFNTKEFANQNHISIEMAARDLRYQWFDRLMVENGYSYLVTAHHLNDQIETFFINLARGCGIHGLTAMKHLSGKIFRPLLTISRNELEAFANENSIKYRTDSTNLDQNIIRNKIRHTLIPLFEGINPEFVQTMSKNLFYLTDTELIYEQTIEKLKCELIIKSDDCWKIEIQKLKKRSPLKTYTYELLKPYGFDGAITEDIINALDGISGKVFYSENFELLKDRDFLIIRKKQIAEKVRITIQKEDSEIRTNEFSIDFQQLKNTENFNFSREPEIASFDFDKLKWPLILRNWEIGDYFYPIGMKNRKKLSDFFNDKKLSIFDKNKTLVITSGTDIIWVVGMRMDDRFKITPETKNVLIIRKK